MRGNQDDVLAFHRGKWSIPAYAGEPRLAWIRRWCSRVYPRVCGGTADGGNNCGLHNGLSPRMRGNPLARRPRLALRRSIPAYAGEPRQTVYNRATEPVYPRVCGGTLIAAGCAKAALGLSPRMRGNPVAGGPVGGPLRSIPAYAGEPRAAGNSAAFALVYPRVCGGTCAGVTGLAAL